MAWGTLRVSDPEDVITFMLALVRGGGGSGRG